MIEAEANVLNIFSKMKEAVEAPMAKQMRERDHWGATVSLHLQWEKWQKKIRKRLQKR